MSDDLGATMRNEAILLLGMFRPQAQDACNGPESESWHNFLAEAARIWGKVRPDKGLVDIDRRLKRNVYGFALEAWARQRLGMVPLHPAYVLAETRYVYRLMTGGGEIQIMTREQDPLGSEAYDIAINAKPQAIPGVGVSP